MASFIINVDIGIIETKKAQTHTHKTKEKQTGKQITRTDEKDLLTLQIWHFAKPNKKQTNGNIGQKKNEDQSRQSKSLPNLIR